MELPERPPSMAPTSQYVHGTSPEEQDRLTLLNSLINKESLSVLELRPGMSVVDFGCGLGQFTREIAGGVQPGGRVVGIERSPDQLRSALEFASKAGEASIVDFRQGDAYQPPLSEKEMGTFDIAHTRFVLEHVPDPLFVVKTMVRAVREGGRIVLEDDDHDVIRLWPEVPMFWPLWSAYVRTYTRLGNDPYVGRKLVSLLRQAGATPVKNRWLWFGSCSGDPMFDAYVENLVGVIAGAREYMLEEGKFDNGTFAEAIQQIRTWQRQDDAALWYSRAWAEGVKR